MAPKLRGFEVRAGTQLLVVFAVLAALGCVGASPGGGSTSSGGISTSGGSISGGGPIAGSLVFDAGAGGAFGPVAVAAGGGEGELFFSQASDGGYTYFLQHLTPSAGVSKDWVELAAGTPTAPPKVAVCSSGKEVTCCWEDWGGINGSHTKGQVIRCNTVPVNGTAPDSSLQGGFSDVGSQPELVRGANNTVVAYTEEASLFLLETILDIVTPGTRSFQTQFPIFDWHLAPDNDGFSAFLADGGAIELSAQGPALQNDGGLSATGVPGEGHFAVAANAGPTTATVIVAHQGGSVVASIFDASGKTQDPMTATLSAADEAPTDAVAAASCNATIFGVAYGLSGGNIGFRSMNLTAALGPERVIDAGFSSDATTVSLAAVDGGVLLAAGTTDQIAVFAVPCP